MAAPWLLRTPRLLPHVGWAHYRQTSSSSALSFFRQRILHSLDKYFYDIEVLTNWSIQLKHWNLRRKNAHYAYTEREYGKYVAAAYYTLCQGGGVRFQGHTDWYRADSKGRFSWQILELKHLPVECVDISNSPLTYRGLDNIVPLRELRELYLRECHHLDDWGLTRLHVFKDCLEALSLAGCTGVTERGLASLHHLQKLRHLDVSNLPLVQNKGLVRILLEEMLPECRIVGMDYTDGLTEVGNASPTSDQRMSVLPNQGSFHVTPRVPRTEHNKPESTEPFNKTLSVSKNTNFTASVGLRIRGISTWHGKFDFQYYIPPSAEPILKAFAEDELKKECSSWCVLCLGMVYRALHPSGPDPCIIRSLCSISLILRGETEDQGEESAGSGCRRKLH
ncbi:distal membrane-arm assembly complex protein 2 [Pelodytes ibericus]